MTPSRLLTRLTRFGPYAQGAAVGVAGLSAVVGLLGGPALAIVFLALAVPILMTAWLVVDTRREMKRLRRTVVAATKRPAKRPPSAPPAPPPSPPALTSVRQAHRTARMLWLGFEETALGRLDELAWSTASSPVCRTAAFTEVARWYAVAGDHDRSIRNVELALASRTAENGAHETLAIAIDLFVEAGRRDEAFRILDGADDEFRQRPDNILRNVNIVNDPADPGSRAHALAILNRIYSSIGCAPIAPTEPARGLRIDNLRSLAPPAPADRGEELVSVIMPVRNGAATIEYAIRSLLAQSWSNLEILVVDDGSSDATIDLVRSMSDPRIRTLDSDGHGAYAARNAGLREATGSFITVHDADDWSHPQKLERQIVPLLDNEDLVGTRSAWVRTTSELRFVEPALMPRERKIIPNISSFMARRGVFDSVGTWDDAAAAADAEFFRRVRSFHGADTVIDVDESVPLSFGLRADDSITTRSATSMLSLHHCTGSRRLYRASHDVWHRSDSFRSSLPYVAGRDPRPFPRPRSLDPVGGPPPRLDVVLIGDFSIHGGSTLSTIQEIRAQSSVGLRTGLIHVPVYMWEFNRNHESVFHWRPYRPINPKLLDVVDGEQVRFLTSDESVEADVVLIRPPRVLQEPIRSLPSVSSPTTIVVVNAAPNQVYGDKPIKAYDLLRCRDTLRTMGHDRVTFQPIGATIRTALDEHHVDDLAHLDIAVDNWENIIDIGAWIRPGRPETGAGRAPRLGRHSRDHDTKWPENDDLWSIYPTDPAVEVHVLGGAAIPEQRRGQLPENWIVHPFDSMHPREFLAGLDVYVYFTHTGWVEAFGRSILEALAVGVPVIAHPTFEGLFGDAVIYAEPRDVRREFDRLIGDDEHYARQVERGHDLVRRRFSWETHLRRLERVRERNTQR